MKNRKMLMLAACGAALTLAGCATTTFVTTWKAPDAQPLGLKAGDKVGAIVMGEQESIRRSGEANLADVLDKAGLKGVPAYTLANASDLKNEAKTKQVIDASGAVGIIVLRPMGKEKEISSTPTGHYGSPYYGGYWGGYHGYGCGGAWGGYEVRTDTYVFVETLIYDLRQNKLVWAGQTKTMNPSDVERFVGGLAEAVSRELKSSGLVAAK